MPQLILGVHSGSHDAAAAVFEDYSLKAAVHLERLTRRKSDGSRHPDAAIDEVLSIAGATRRDVDVVTYSRSMAWNGCASSTALICAGGRGAS